MNELDLNKLYKVNDLIVSKKDSHGINMLVSLDESNFFYRIDGIASSAWDMLVEGLSFQEISEKLISQYPEHKTQVIQDLEEFFKQLIEMKILE
jgi:hypothetical protein